MRGTLLCLLILAGMPTGVGPANADDAPGTPTMERTDAFEKAYGASFYEFDACGDGIAGRIYRSALADKLKQCPFSESAKKRFQARATAQRRKSSQAMAKLIEDHGGLPMRLEGMTRSCREQFDSPEYRQVRSRLDEFSAGRLASDAVVTQPCDAAEINP
jgi:hypothetical protein